MQNDKLNRNNAAHRSFPRKKGKLTLRDIRRVKTSGTPVSYDDVLDFHIWLKNVRGIGPADIDIFKKISK